MADQVTDSTTTNESTESQPSENVAQPSEASEVKEPSIAELKAALDRSRAESAQARKDAEGAQAYVQSILGTIRAAATAGAGGGGGGGRSDEPPPDIRERLNENPEAVLDEHFKTRMGPLYNAYLQNQDLQNRELAKERILRDENLRDENDVSFWTKYEKEINEFMGGMPAEVRARPGAYERALKFVMADKIDEVTESRAARIAKRREARERGAFVEGPSGAAPRGKQPAVLSALEKEVAKGLGLSEQQFLDAKQLDQWGNKSAQ